MMKIIAQMLILIYVSKLGLPVSKYLITADEHAISSESDTSEIFKIARGGTFSLSMSKNGFANRDIHNIVEIGSEFINFKSLTPNIEFRFNKDRNFLQIKTSPKDFLSFHKLDQKWTAWQVQLTETVQIETFQGNVENSLWDSAILAKMSPEIIMILTEIFAWQIDFSREVRKNDSWRITIEKKYVRGEFTGWGSIIAAEYINNDRSYKAFRFVTPDGLLGYFNENGESLQKIFLKSPLKFARISSRFSRRRFHPIRKVYRPHLGVDYAARQGTPVRSVGDGVLVVRGRRGGAGKMIKIRHNSVYETAYMHLHQYARALRVGSRVKQGQIIGYVGKTGLATGPHLHYEFYKNKHYVDPLSVEFPSAHPVPARHKSRFYSQVKKSKDLLPDWSSSVAAQ